jgi:hypothetical protein
MSVELGATGGGFRRSEPRLIPDSRSAVLRRSLSLRGLPPHRKDVRVNSAARLIVIILLVLLIVGLLPAWPYSSGWGLGYYPSGGLALLLIVVIVLALAGGDRRLR